MSNQAITITTGQAPEFLTDILRANLVPMLVGSPGLGKSSVAAQVAKEFNLKVIDLRLTQCDPTDLAGFPFLDKDTKKADYVPMSTFPIKGDELPIKQEAVFDDNGKEILPEVRYDGWLLLLDEFNSATQSVQAAAYKLTLDRMVGQNELHERVKVMCAGNLATDKAIVNRMSTAMQSRLIHLEMELNAEDWLDWADKSGIDYRIKSYIRFAPESLHKFSADHDDKTFPCPRTWEFASKLIEDWNTVPYTKIPVLAGTIGQGMANEFIGYCGIFESLPTIQELISKPDEVTISEKPDVQYAIGGLISNHVDKTNIDKLIKVIKRLPIEHQIITLTSSIKRDMSLFDNPEVRKWCSENAQELM